MRNVLEVSQKALPLHSQSRKLLSLREIAEIAQLVEHNLAKVRVASSSLVFRSRFFEIMKLSFAQVAELVDAHVSGACVERHAGSSPVLGTTHEVFVSGGMAELVDAPL